MRALFLSPVLVCAVALAAAPGDAAEAETRPAAEPVGPAMVQHTLTSLCTDRTEPVAEPCS